MIAECEEIRAYLKEGIRQLMGVKFLRRLSWTDREMAVYSERVRGIRGRLAAVLARRQK